MTGQPEEYPEQKPPPPPQARYFPDYTDDEVARWLMSKEADALAGDSGIIFAEATDHVWGARVGMSLLTNVHAPDKCAGEHCIIHKPSDHHMREWPMLWRDDRGIFERTCPHGVGHPDPDQLEFWRKIGREGNAVHGCDGCCRPPGATISTEV